MSFYGYNVYDLFDPVFCRFPIYCKDWSEVESIVAGDEDRFCVFFRRFPEDDYELSFRSDYFE